MKVKILQLLKGAKKAKGLVVIIDVFRAFTVEAYLFSNGCNYIVPVRTIKEAFDYKNKHPEAILIGERHGKKIEGFDYGNSPSEIEKINFKNKVIVHTTSAGIQGIVNAKNASKIIVGSLVNSKAIADYIRSSNYDEISLVCMGLEGKKKTLEDTFCARYIKSILMNKKINKNRYLKRIQNTSGKKFFDPNLSSIFPKNDYFLSTRFDIFDFIIEVKNEDENFKNVKN